MNVGIHGFSGLSKAFREFIALMDRRVSNSSKHWMYFPFNAHENINAAWIRKLRICRGPGSNPILVVSGLTLGPQSVSHE